MAKQGRPPKLSAEGIATLKAIVEANPTATMDEVRDELERRTGTRAHGHTIEKALSTAGIERRTDGAGVRAEQTYSSCLTDAEWQQVSDLFEPRGGRGKPPKYPRRLLLDACCYVVRTGCSWRMLPKSFPPWQNVYRTFRRWSAQGRFEQMHDRLRAQWREREQRAAEPSAAVLDAQSNRGSPQGGDNGYDAGKKVKGRKRHLVIDTLGLLLAVSVTAASVQDRDGAHPVMATAMAKYPGVETLFVDSGYAGRCAQTVSQCHDLQVQVVRHPTNRNVGRWTPTEQPDLFTVQADAQGFVVLAKRWVVERTHAWVERARRLVMHHDRLSRVSEAWVWLTEARRLLQRLTA